MTFSTVGSDRHPLARASRGSDVGTRRPPRGARQGGQRRSAPRYLADKVKLPRRHRADGRGHHSGGGRVGGLGCGGRPGGRHELGGDRTRLCGGPRLRRGGGQLAPAATPDARPGLRRVRVAGRQPGRRRDRRSPRAAGSGAVAVVGAEASEWLAPGCHLRRSRSRSPWVWADSSARPGSWSRQPSFAALPSEGHRRAGWPSTTSVGVVGLVLAGSWVWSRTDPQGFNPDGAVTAYEVALVVTAVTVVVVRQRHRASREHELQAALATVTDGGMAAFVELLRRAVGDPTLEVVDPGDRVTAPASPKGGTRTLTVTGTDGTPLCVVTYRSSALSDPVTASRVAAATRSAVEHVRLTDELTAQLAEEEASRARLLTATDLERATAAAELHDTRAPAARPGGARHRVGSVAHPRRGAVSRRRPGCRAGAVDHRRGARRPRGGGATVPARRRTSGGGPERLVRAQSDRGRHPSRR